MTNKLQEMLDFIHESPVCFFAAANVKKRLQDAGYEEVTDLGVIKTGGKYFLTRNNSAVIAFRVPEGSVKGFVISAAHSDSPCLKIRDKAELEGGVAIRLDTERYGGMINACWVDRPLSVAGRVMVRTENGVAVRLVDLKKDMALIPNVAIHMNRAMNDSVKYDPAKDLVAVYGETENKGRFYEEIAEAAGCAKEDILGTDLYLYNNQAGTVWGPSGEYVSSPRLDDLACVFSCLEAFLTAKDTDRVPVLCVFDNEEIGSGTKQGAGSDFLPRVLKGISRGLGLNENAHYVLLDNSFFLSCDNGHAKHPNHPEMADTNEYPVVNGGIVIKHSPKYATDAVSCAVFTEICRRAGVKLQSYANRPDIVGGGTLGLIADTKTPVYTVDIGMAQWAMHSNFETCGSRDIENFILGVKAAYETTPDFTDERVTF